MRFLGVSVGGDKSLYLPPPILLYEEGVGVYAFSLSTLQQSTLL